MRTDTSPGPSVSGPLVPFRHPYQALDFDFEIINLYTLTYSLQPYYP